MSAFDLFDCFCCKRTGLDGGMFLTQHLIGIKDARRGVAMFWCFNEFVGGAQLTCTIIANYLATLGDLSKKTVFLQLDNCGGHVAPRPAALLPRVGSRTSRCEQAMWVVEKQRRDQCRKSEGRRHKCMHALQLRADAKVKLS